MNCPNDAKTAGIKEGDKKGRLYKRLRQRSKAQTGQCFDFLQVTGW